ncbi:MAG: flagellar hook capping FlgD N-terminal domain-containing protein [Planctomycetota bacterium]
MLPATAGIMGTQGQQNPTGANAIADVDLDDFLKLFIAELQNQDPLNPMGNNEMLQQLSQIREIESNDRLTETLESVLLGQSLTTASSLIGRSIVAMAEDGATVTGRVDRVSIVDGMPKLNVDGQVLDLKNVSEILDESTGAQDGDSSGEDA